MINLFFGKNRLIIDLYFQLIFLKLIPLLFPTSDYYHPVSTPASVFSGQILFRNSCSNLQLIAKGLFLAIIILEVSKLLLQFQFFEK